MRRFPAFAAILVTFAGMAGCEDPAKSAAADAGPVLLDGSIDAVGLETLGPTQVRAGSAIELDCLLVDVNGDFTTPPDAASIAYRIEPSASVMRTNGEWIATVTGELQIACEMPALALRDTSPARVIVVPGSAARAAVQLDRDRITAGESVRATCELVDAFGNSVASDSVMPTLMATPSANGNSFAGLIATFERSGLYDVVCDVAGATNDPARLEVLPSLATRIVASLSPAQDVYAVGSLVSVRSEVTDRFGNLIPNAEVEITSAGAEALGANRLRYAMDGRYSVTATVLSGTQNGQPVSAMLDVVVDSYGPAIDCLEPVNGGFVDGQPGQTIIFRGRVADTSGVSSVMANGIETPTDAASGEFTVPIQTQFGINFVEVVAADTTLLDSGRTCAFIVANRWANRSALDDSVTFRLSQRAIDDGVRDAELNSLTDILQRAISSDELASTLDQALLAANPLKPSSCDRDTFLGCALRSEIRYVRSELGGPNTVSLLMVEDGLRVQLEMMNPRIRLRVRGTITAFDYDTEGWVSFDRVQVRAIFDVALTNGRPQVRVRPGSAFVELGNLSTDFEGIDGGIIDIVASVGEGLVRSQVEDIVSNYVTNNLGSLLDGVLGGLDLAALGTSLSVPRIDGGAPIELRFTPSFSSLDASSTRFLFGIGTALQVGAAAHARPTLGAPIPAGQLLHDPRGTTAAGLAIQIGVLNQVLHELWRGGMFDIQVDSSVYASLPNDLEATLRLDLPPVAELMPNGRVQVSLGGAHLDVNLPSQLAMPISATVGVRASVAIALENQEFAFRDIQIDELHLTTDANGGSVQSRDTLVMTLRELLSNLIDSTLSNALPSIPIPAFALPSSLTRYGIPADSELGLRDPMLSTEGDHLILRGNFGVQ